MLRRAISNLLSNTMRYTPPEHLPRLFDRFYHVTPSRQRKGEGRGIGLAIVKSIVIAHQGKVSVASDTRATRFILTSPKYLR
ncbi:ATP-binding protein [Salmonella enterica subsp. enterica]|nr:ATP-binding protein [Salmonella enterica subsp. enterica]